MSAPLLRTEALAGGGKPELEFGGTDGDDVTIPKDCGLNGFAVDGGQGVGRGCERETCPPVEFQCEVLIPNAVVVELQFVARRSSDAERKTAGCRLDARLFAGKDVELYHHQILRGTWTWSLG